MSTSDREVDLRQLRQDAALQLCEDSPAIFKGEEQASDAPSTLQEWQPVLEFKEKHSSVSGSSGGELAEWEVLSPSRASVCGSSPRSLSVADCFEANVELDMSRELRQEGGTADSGELQGEVVTVDDFGKDEASPIFEQDTVCVKQDVESIQGACGFTDVVHSTEESSVVEPMLAMSEPTVGEDMVTKCEASGNAPAVSDLVDDEWSFPLTYKLSKAGCDSATKLWTWLNGCVDSIALVSSRPVFGFSSAHLKSNFFQLNWGQVTLGASMVAVLGAMGLVLYQNHKLTRSLKQKDREVAKLVMKILSLQDTLHGSRRGPMVRQTAWSIFPTEFM